MVGETQLLDSEPFLLSYFEESISNYFLELFLYLYSFIFTFRKVGRDLFIIFSRVKYKLLLYRKESKISDFPRKVQINKK